MLFSQRSRRCQAILVVGLVTSAVLAGAECHERRDTEPITTQPAERQPPWPGPIGRVNQLAVLIHGTGRIGFAVTVTTLERGRTGRERMALEDGSFSFRLYPASGTQGPDLDRLIGTWAFDDATARQHWSPTSWLGRSTYAFLLPWSEEMPPVGTNLVLVTQFTPQGRQALPPHLTSFVMQPISPAAP